MNPAESCSSHSSSLPLAADELWAEALRSGQLALIVIDHGSRRAASNEALLDVVDNLRKTTRFRIIEPAHMELAEPSLATAFAAAVGQGARRIVVHPYFLFPGRHWQEDIPRLAAAAAAAHPQIPYLVTAPLGLHPLIPQIVVDRVGQCLLQAAGEVDQCDLCRGTGQCGFRVAQGGFRVAQGGFRVAQGGFRVAQTPPDDSET